MSDETKKGLAETPAPFAGSGSGPGSGPGSGKRDTLKVRRIGNSLGVVLPKDLLARLGAAEGDELVVSDSEAGLHLQRRDDAHDAHMRLVEQVMARYPNTLKALAK